MKREEIPRAPRYPVELDVRFRLGDGLPWRSGRTRNMSSSGVLFCADGAVPLETPLEMNLFMPAQIAGGGGSRVMCFGRVARIVERQGEELRPSLAVTIAGYRLVRAVDEV